MLEPCIHQAAGLQNLALQLPPRLVAVASHGQQQGELPLLWGLCNRWVDIGLSVLVLDGHALESPGNPGLAQWLSNPLDRLSDEDGPVSWQVIAAANGLAQLADDGLMASRWGSLFKNYAVVLVYADAASLTQLLRGCALAPLLVVPPAKAAALTAYQALKELLINGQLRPTVANIVPETNPMQPTPNATPAQNVMDCASNYLGYRAKSLSITASARADRSQDDLDRLAVQLLENAMLLEPHPTARVH